MPSSNPTLKEDTFEKEALVAQGEPMTIQGTIGKSVALLAITGVAAAFSWNNAGGVGSLLSMGGLIGGLVICLVLCFKHTLAPYLAPAYAVCQGLFVGALSAHYNQAFSGLPLQAVMLTFGVFFGLLGAYQTGIIRATDGFRRGIVAATLGIFITYLATMALGLFGIQIPYIHGSGWIGIGFSLFVVTIAALNLVLDFDLIEQGSRVGAPKYMEWYAAFGLLVTLIWLYIEILRLLSKFRSR